MQLDLEVRGRKVVIVGTLPAAHRVIKRYRAAGAQVTAVIEGALPRPADRPADVRYAVQPEGPRLTQWVNVLGPCWLVVTVGVSAAIDGIVGRVSAQLGILRGSEQPAAGHGVVTLVGGGPGLTSLLTLQACEALREADVVFYDRLAPTDDLEALAPAAELVDVGKRPQHHPVSQHEIQSRMIDRASRGAAVVRLKGGDPFVFGRGGEEVMACLDAGVAVRVVPGVSSSLSVPASVGIPVTHRGISRAVTVVSGHDPLSANELSALARLRGTVVIVMGVNNLPQISAGLVRAGMPADTPAAVIERGYSEAQRTTVAPLDRLAAEARRVEVTSPAVIVVGEVVRLVGLGADAASSSVLQSLATLSGRGLP